MPFFLQSYACHRSVFVFQFDVRLVYPQLYAVIGISLILVQQCNLLIVLLLVYILVYILVFDNSLVQCLLLF